MAQPPPSETVVLLTGASSGIGWTTAHLLAKKGYRVYGTSRKPEKFQDQNLPFEMIAMDLMDTDSVNQAVAVVLEKEGRIDVLVNNAGYAIMGPLEDCGIEQSQQVFETNVIGVQRTISAVLPSMRERRAGKIINVSSIAGQFGLPFRSVYSASKAALGKLIESIQYELEPFNIHAVIVEPGDVKTPISDHRGTPKNPQSGDAYTKRFNHIADKINADVEHGWPAEKVAIIIEKVIRKRKPRVRYIASPFIPLLAVIINHLVPSRMFKWIIKTESGLK